MRWWRFVSLIVLACLVVGGLWFIQQAYVGTTRAAAVVHVEIADGSDVASVARLLEQNGIITSAFWYRMFGLLESAVRRPRAGAYVLRPGTSWRTVARTVALGPERQESSVTVIEGWTVDDIADLLLKDKGVALEMTRALIGRSADRAPFDPALRRDFSFLSRLSKSRSLEGYLFPETYRVWDDQLPEGLVRKQLDEFETRFGGARVTEKSAPLSSLDEAVILASIVEKEVRSPEDRRHVAGIFLNRLRIRMALQSDATLSYVTGSNRAQANASDLAHDSAYNTYKYPGLPPGPICNPGGDAIQAVLDPLSTDDLYFLTDKNGNVLYAKTLEEHTKNRQKAGI